MKFKSILFAMLTAMCTLPLMSAVIVKDNQSDYEVIIRSNAPQATKLAAEELSLYITKSSGVKLPVKNTLTPGKKALYVGKNAAVQLDPAAFSDPEEYRVIELKDGSIAFVAQETDLDPYKEVYGNFSILYCVYDFLQRTTGVRWYAPGEFGECIEKRSVIESGKLPFGDKPLTWLRYYWPWTFSEFTTRDSMIFGRRHRGFGLRYGGANHSMNDLSLLYKDTKPEIFAVLPDGKTRRFGKLSPKSTPKYHRYTNYPQYCFTNPETLKAYCDFIDAVYEGRPEGNLWTACRPTDKAVYVVPPDNFTTQPCACQNCKAVIDSKSQGRGSMTPLVWGFVKKVAEYVKKKYPDKQVMALAYEGYYEPPTFDLPDNVVVQICVNPYMIYMGALAFRKAFDEQLNKWRKKVKAISIWHYLLPYDYIPYSMPNIMYQWVRDYPEIKAIFWEITDTNMRPQAYRLKEHKVRTACDLAQLHINLFFYMRSVWSNPTDVRAELDRYYKLFYGPAAPAMKKFHDTAIKQWENVKNITHSAKTSYPKFPGKNLYEDIYSPEVIRVMKDSLAEAEKLAGKDTIYAKRLKWLRDSFIDRFFVSADAFAAEAKVSRDQLLFPAKDKVKIDGKLDDKFYDSLPTHKFVRTDAPLPARFGTEFKMGVADGKLIVGVKAQDPDNHAARVERTAHDADIFMDDSIEIFVLSDPDNLSLVKNVTINLAGVTADYERGGKRPGQTWESGAQTAVVRGKDFYTMEFAIPLEKLEIKNNTFRMNLCRNKYSGVGENFERSVWSCTYGGFWMFGQIPYIRIVPAGTTYDDFSSNHWSYRSFMVPMDRLGKRYPHSQKGVKVTHKSGELTLQYTFDKSNQERDYGNFNAVKLKNADMTGKPCVEIRFKNPDKALHHLATYSFLGTDGKRYGGYIRFCNDEAYDTFRTRKFNVATDSNEGKNRAKKGLAQPTPAKLLTFQIYSSCTERDGKPRELVLDYIRVAE